MVALVVNALLAVATDAAAEAAAATAELAAFVERRSVSRS